MQVDAYEERTSLAKRQKLELEEDPELAAAMSLSKGEAGLPPTAREEEPPVVPIVPLAMCLARMGAPAPLDNFRGRTGALKTTRFATFPRYLMMTLQRYYTSQDWQAKKMSVEVPMPLELDLSAWRTSGPKEGEALLPDSTAGGGGGAAGAPAPPPAALLAPDETIVAQLLSMGFSENGSKRAAIAVQNANAEAAAEWVFAHMDDADFNEPLPPPAAADAPARGGGVVAVDMEAVMMLEGMGFTETQAKGALSITGNNLERAADWLFSHSDDLDGALAQELYGGPTARSNSGGGGGGGGGPAGAAGAAGAAGGGGGAPEAASDGPGTYELLAIISHMGSNTSCGHYVCHVRKQGRWVLYNDQKVAASEEPPLALGYMYLYKRTDA